MSRSTRSPARVLGQVPISVRLGATFAAVFLVVLTAVSGLAYWRLGQTLRSEIDRTLVSAASALGGSERAREIDDRELGGVESPEFETQVLTADGGVVEGSESDLRTRPVLSPEQVDRTLRDGVLFLDAAEADGDPERALATRLEEQPDRVLVVVAELDPVQDAQEGLLRLAVTLGPLAALLAGGAGWMVARRGLQPIARMTADAQAIGARDPFPRLAVPPSRDEVARLGTTFNGLLTRIEEARRREREFTADASHELRTPVAVLRAELELARHHADSGELVRSLDSALEECDRLGALVDDLLLLARNDAGMVTPSAPVDVGEVTDGLLPGFRTLAGRRGITLDRTGDAVVHADGRALARAVANLLDNAVRHAPDGGHVELTIAPRAGGTAITVTDDGPGIPAADRVRLTQRFTQMDRAKSGGGAGLGLAIVASVAAAHGGWVEITDPPSGRGVSVSLVLPSGA